MTAGKAPESYLIIKLEGRQGVGGRMPFGGAPLDAIDMQSIKNWINKRGQGPLVGLRGHPLLRNLCQRSDN